MTKPSLLPSWSTDAAADIDNPGTVKQALGWLLRERPPHGVFNWWQNLVGQWLTYIDTEVSVPRFDSVEALVADIPVGGYGSVVAGLGDDYPFRQLWTKTALQLGAVGQTCELIASDGEVVAVASSDYIRAFKVSDGTELWSFGHGFAVTNKALVSDGRNFVWSFSSSVVVFDRLTGAIKNTIGTAAGDASLMVTDGRHLYVNLASGLGIEAWQDYDVLSGESTAWSSATLSAGKTIQSMATNGKRVVITHLNAASGQNYKLYFASNGAVIGVGEIDPTAANVDTANVYMSRDHIIFQMADQSVFVEPITHQLPTAGGFPGAYNRTDSGGSLVGPTGAAVIRDVSSEYLVALDVIGEVVAVYNAPDAQSDLAPVYIEEWTASIDAVALDQTTLFIGGSENAGIVMVARNLPPKFRTMRRCDVTDGAEPYRAPHYGVVTVESFK